MYRRLLDKPLNNRKSFFLFGPRGTGKTSWLKENFPENIYIDLLSNDTFLRLSRHPTAIEEFFPASYNGWIIIDEVQRVPPLLHEVHRLIEARKLLFAITGSSTRKIIRKDGNLLAGRALFFQMHPFVAQELGDDFSLEKSLKYGMLPAVLNETNPMEYLKTYVHLYLREEVMEEGLTRNLSAFNRFLEVASFSQAQVLNMSAIAREAEVSEKTVRNYFFLLEDLLLGARIPVFSKRSKRKDLVKNTKFFFFDVGVFRALRPTGPFDKAEEIEGAALETLFFQSLKAINDLYGLGYQVYYWRTYTGHEVDFVLYGEGGIKAFEIKRSKKVTRADAKNLSLFSAEYPSADCFLLYGGKEQLFFGNTKAVPFAQAIQTLPELLKIRKE